MTINTEAYNSTNLLSESFVVQKSEMNFTMLKNKDANRVTLLYGGWGESISLPFIHLQVDLIPWLMTFILHL